MSRNSEGAPLIRDPAARKKARNARAGGRTYSGMAFKNPVDPSAQSMGFDAEYGVTLEEFSWYHGSISSGGAEHRLKTEGLADGLFLFRTRGVEHVLCLCYNHKVENYLIKNKQGGFSIGEESPLFYSLPNMVTYFRDNRGGLPCLLLYECPKSQNSADSHSSIPEEDHFSELKHPVHMGKNKKPMLSRREKKERAARKKKLREQQLQEQLNSLPAYRPWLTKGLAVLMGIILVAELIEGGISEIAFPGQPAGQIQIQKNFTAITETVSDAQSSNIMIGPNTAFLIKYGAKFGPCMREDIAYKATRAISWEREESLGLGCCTVTALNQCGMASQTECLSVTSATWDSAKCSSSCSGASTIVRPCCYLDGRCEVTRTEFCTKTGGVPSVAGQTCATAKCLSQICGLSGVPNENADQWYRFITPIFLHAGVLHYIGNMMLQLSLGVQIERVAGTLRTALIYFIAGIGGYLTSGVFSPNIPSVGASAASFGLLGISVVDLFQSWQLVKDPWKRLFWTTIETCIYLGLGLLPFVDNWAHVGGFVFGILAAIVFLPYLTFGLLDSLRKRCFMIFCIPTLMALYFIFFLVFYSIQSTDDFCPGCKYLQCYPFTKDFCKDVPGWTE